MMAQQSVIDIHFPLTGDSFLSKFLSLGIAASLAISVGSVVLVIVCISCLVCCCCQRLGKSLPDSSCSTTTAATAAAASAPASATVVTHNGSAPTTQIGKMGKQSQVLFSMNVQYNARCCQTVN